MSAVAEQPARGSMFRSLRNRNYRLWASGAIVSNVGTWMQRTTQDWIVLTLLTHDDAFAVGVTMALQFGPQIVLLPLTGLVADRFPKRSVLMVTQVVMGVLALLLGVMVLTGTATLFSVDMFALLLGCTAAFDAPSRQAFVSDLVGGKDVTNAVALNSASFNSARLIGPAVAGLLIESVGAGWVFLINAASFAAVLVALKLVRVDVVPGGAKPRIRGGMVEGFRYVRSRSDLLVTFSMILLIGAIGLNLPIYASTMAVLFRSGASGYGALTSVMAIGSVFGALLSARRAAPRFQLLIVAGALFCIGLVLGGLAPSYWFLAIVLPLVGVAAQTFMTTANGLVQLSAPAEVRGRVMALYMAIFQGSTVVGAPIVGWIANAAGPRVGLFAGASAGLLAAAIGAAWLLHTQRRDRPAVVERHA